MSCCGEKRVQFRKKTAANQVFEQKELTSSLHQTAPAPIAYFQYVGKQGLLVIGRETRRRYRFDKPGAVVAVDTRDQRALEGVPTLRLVKTIAS